MTTRKTEPISVPQYTPGDDPMTLTPLDGGIVTNKPTPVEKPNDEGKGNPPVPDPSKPTGTAEENTEGQIVFHERVLVDGVAEVIVHGPMPVSEWTDYERKHGL